MVYNLTTFTASGNEVGAILSVSIITGAILAVASHGMLGVGKRKRRALGQDHIQEAFSRNVVKMVSGLDKYGCVAGALCESASTEPFKRTTGQDVLLNVLGWQPDGTAKSLSWHKMNKAESKYPYAVQVGRSHGDCNKAFPWCPVPFWRVSDEFSRKITSCAGGAEAASEVIDLMQAASEGAEQAAQDKLQGKARKRRGEPNTVVSLDADEEAAEDFRDVWDVEAFV